MSKCVFRRTLATWGSSREPKQPGLDGVPGRHAPQSRDAQLGPRDSGSRDFSARFSTVRFLKKHRISRFGPGAGRPRHPYFYRQWHPPGAIFSRARPRHTQIWMCNKYNASSRILMISQALMPVRCVLSRAVSLSVLLSRYSRRALSRCASGAHFGSLPLDVFRRPLAAFSRRRRPVRARRGKSCQRAARRRGTQRCTLRSLLKPVVTL